VADRIESGSPGEFGGGITQGQGSAGMSILMDGDGKKEHRDFHNPF
jgi:hypothetical protein